MNSNLKQLLKERGMKQTYLAKQIDVSDYQVSEWCKEMKISVKMGLRIKEALKLERLEELWE